MWGKCKFAHAKSMVSRPCLRPQVYQSFLVCLRMPIYAMDTSSRISDALASLVKHGQAALETDNMSNWDVMLPALVGFSLPTSNLPNLSTFTVLPMFSHICISMCHNKVAAWDTRSLIYLAVQYLPKDISQFVQFDFDPLPFWCLNLSNSQRFTDPKK